MRYEQPINRRPSKRRPVIHPSVNRRTVARAISEASGSAEKLTAVVGGLGLLVVSVLSILLLIGNIPGS